MKSMTKKIGSIMLALCLCFSLCCTAFAASGTGGSITIEGVKTGESYSIYKIFDLTYADDESSYAYTVAEAWSEVITSSFTFTVGTETYTPFTIDSDGYLNPDSGVFSYEDDGDLMAALAKALLSSAAEITATSTAKGQEGQESVKFENLDLGWYLVDTSLGTLCMLTNTVPDAEINEKNAEPTVDNMYVIDKTKGEEDFDHDKDTASVIDTLKYEIILSSAANSSGLVLHVSLDQDLTLVSNSIVVKLSNGADVDSSYYEITFTDDGFEISFKDDFLAGLSSDDLLYVTFDAAISATAGDFTGDLADFKSNAWLTYGDAQTSTPVTADVYSYGFEVYKYTSSSTSEESRLAGAVFTLQNEAGQYGKFDTTTNTYVLTGWEEGIIDDCYMTSTATGNILIEGLDLGTYTLTETAAPDGYNKLENPLTITIAADEEDYSIFTVTVSTNDEDGETAADHIVKVLNNQGPELPGTGGIGTTIFYIIGGILVVGAVVVLVTRRRMNREA